MTQTLDRRRRLRRVAAFYRLELLCGPFRSTYALLGGEEQTLKVLRAAWAEVEREQVYGGCKRPWAWWTFTRGLPCPEDPVEQAVALNAAGELTEQEVKAMIAAAERVLDTMGWVVWHGRQHQVLIAEALIEARGIAPLGAYEVRS